MAKLGTGWFRDKAHSNEFIAEIQSSSDRAAAILSMNFLDQSMKKAIEELMPGGADATATKRLFEQNFALHSMDTKIRLLNALGFFGETTLQNLTYAQKIRNTFAHSMHPMDFDTPGIADICKLFVRMPAAFGMADVPYTSARDRYLATVFEIARAVLMITMNSGAKWRIGAAPP